MAIMTNASSLKTPGLQRFPSNRIVLFIQREFLSPEECAALIERIDVSRRPSTIADAYNNDSSFRTSETCDLSSDDPFVAAINRKIDIFAGLESNLGEPLQGQRYAVGQEFKAHTDYFEPDGADYPTYCSVAGNRTWTFMVYLNRPDAGGATRFTRLDKTIQPETGKMICWSNRLKNGGVNNDTMHHGMKVRAGTKYVITKWYREKPWG